MAGSIVQGAGIALDIYALINGIGGAGSSPGMQVEIAGGGVIAGAGAQTGTIIGAGSLIGAMLGEGLSSLGEELKDVADESEEAHREELSEVESDTNHMLGENGTQVRGSKTTGQNGKTERVDVENPAPGERPGDVHYHESNNIKWRYDINSKKLIDPKTGEVAPSRVQKVTKEKWFQKAIDKALNILGE